MDRLGAIIKYGVGITCVDRGLTLAAFLVAVAFEVAVPAISVEFSTTCRTGWTSRRETTTTFGTVVEVAVPRATSTVLGRMSRLAASTSKI